MHKYDREDIARMIIDSVVGGESFQEQGVPIWPVKLHDWHPELPVAIVIEVGSQKFSVMVHEQK